MLYCLDYTTVKSSMVPAILWVIKNLAHCQVCMTASNEYCSIACCWFYLLFFISFTLATFALIWLCQHEHVGADNNRLLTSSRVGNLPATLAIPSNHIFIIWKTTKTMTTHYLTKKMSLSCQLRFAS